MHFPQRRPMPEWASFDSSYTNTPQEYAGWGAGLYMEPALKVTFPDGNRDLVLHYESHTATANGFDVVLKDISRPIFVTLHYAMDPESGILARSATIENRGTEAVTVEQAAAAAWSLPAGQYTLNYLTGRWAGEWTLNQEPVLAGARVIESRRGSTGHQANPWFALQAGEANEDHGEVWFGALAWSGSWRITVEQDQLDAVRVTGGFNPFDFGYVLKPGAELETPVFYGGYSAHGLGGASRLLHHFELEHILPHKRDGAGDAEAAAGDLQLLGSDGIQGERGRADGAGGKSSGAGCGSLCDGRRLVWAAQGRPCRTGRLVCEPGEVSHGLKPLIDKVHALGMDFGLWVEPEMVNPDSDIVSRASGVGAELPGTAARRSSATNWC